MTSYWFQWTQWNFSQFFTGNTPIKVISHSKIQRVIINDDLKWKQHLKHITSKDSQRLHMLVVSRQAGYPSNKINRMHVTKIWVMPE